MSRQTNLRGSIQMSQHPKRVADAAFTAGLIACGPPDPGRTSRITGRIPKQVRPTQPRRQTQLSQTVAEITR